MIAKEAFAREWRILCERFGRDSSQLLAARYYESLSPRMETEEFVGACRIAFDSLTFFPGPDQLHDLVRGTSDERALAEWGLCQRAMEGSREALARMSPPGRKTVDLLGGYDRLRMTQLTDVAFVRKDFLRLFAQADEIHERETKRLPGWTAEGRGAYESLTDGTRFALPPGQRQAGPDSDAA